MSETVSNAEGLEQTSDAFLDGWDETASESAEADQPEQAAEEQTPAETAEAGAEQAQATGAEQEAEGQAHQEQAAPPAADVPKVWTLRHLDEEKTVTEQELITLGQKGLDYDRIRSKYDESKPVMDLFGQFAGKANMSIKDYTAHLRTLAKKASGMNDDEAKRAVELEDREAAVAAKEAQEAEKSAAETRKAAADERRRADVQEFQKAFPDAAKEPDKIPQSVWADVRSGMSLVTAYAKYAVQQAEERAKAADMAASAQQQNSRNAGRSTGSMKSAGGEKKSKDPFLEGWDS